MERYRGTKTRLSPVATRKPLCRHATVVQDEFERSRSAPGRWLADEKKRKDGAHQYGFDAEGRVVVERQLVIIPGWPEAFYEEFYVHGDGVIEGTRYHHAKSKEPINVSRTLLKDGRIVSRASWAVAGCGMEEVCWRDNLPASVAMWNREHESYGGRSVQPVLIQRFEFTHDEAGRLERIDLEYGATKREVYRRAKKGESSVTALKSRASGIVDAWSDTQGQLGLAIPHMALGGGVQYRVLKALTSADDGFAIL